MKYVNLFMDRQKLITNTWKIKIKNKELSYLQYWNGNNLCGWAMSHKLPLNNFEWTKDTSQFNEGVIKNYNEENDKGYFLEVDIQYLEKLHELHNDLIVFYQK